MDSRPDRSPHTSEQQEGPRVPLLRSLSTKAKDLVDGVSAQIRQGMDQLFQVSRSRPPVRGVAQELEAWERHPEAALGEGETLSSMLLKAGVDTSQALDHYELLARIRGRIVDVYAGDPTRQYALIEALGTSVYGDDGTLLTLDACLQRLDLTRSREDKELASWIRFQFSRPTASPSADEEQDVFSEGEELDDEQEEVDTQNIATLTRSIIKELRRDLVRLGLVAAVGLGSVGAGGALGTVTGSMERGHRIMAVQPELTTAFDEEARANDFIVYDRTEALSPGGSIWDFLRVERDAFGSLVVAPRPGVLLAVRTSFDRDGYHPNDEIQTSWQARWSTSTPYVALIAYHAESGKPLGMVKYVNVWR